MPYQQPMPTQAMDAYSSILNQSAAQKRAQAIDLFMSILNAQERDKQNRWGAYGNWAQARDRRKMMMAAQDQGIGGTVGSAIGAGAGLIGAPFTGGASLAMIPAMASIGGSVGNMVDPQAGFSALPFDSAYKMGGFIDRSLRNPYQSPNMVDPKAMTVENPYYAGPTWGIR